MCCVEIIYTFFRLDNKLLLVELLVHIHFVSLVHFFIVQRLVFICFKLWHHLCNIWPSLRPLPSFFSPGFILNTFGRLIYSVCHLAVFGTKSSTPAPTETYHSPISSSSSIRYRRTEAFRRPYRSFFVERLYTTRGLIIIIISSLSIYIHIACMYTA